MKDTFKELAIGFVVLVAIAAVYVFMPFEWRRYKDIKLGNQIAAQIVQYQQKYNKLPENNDEAVFEQLGFRRDKQFGWQPNYQKIPQGFELSYKNGYSQPYLTWQSHQQKWFMKNESSHQ